MAFEEKITQPSQGLTGSLSGRILLDEGKGALIISEGGIDLLTITKDGILLNDGTDRRMIIGKMPDSNIGVVISKPGYDVVDIFS